MSTWTCLACDSGGEGDAATVDRDARRHTERERHATTTSWAGVRTTSYAEGGTP